MEQTPKRRGQARRFLTRGALALIVLLTLALYGLGIGALAVQLQTRDSTDQAFPLAPPSPPLVPTPTQEPPPPIWEPFFITEPVPSNEDILHPPTPSGTRISPTATPPFRLPTPPRALTPSLFPMPTPTPMRYMPTPPLLLPTPKAR